MLPTASFDNKLMLTAVKRCNFPEKVGSHMDQQLKKVTDHRVSIYFERWYARIA